MSAQEAFEKYWETVVDATHKESFLAGRASLIEEIRNGGAVAHLYFDSEGDALEAKDREIAELKAQLGRVQDKVAEYARRLLVKDSTIKQLEEERSTLQDLRDNLQALWKTSHAERSEAMEDLTKAQARITQLEEALMLCKPIMEHNAGTVRLKSFLTVLSEIRK